MRVWVLVVGRGLVVEGVIHLDRIIMLADYRKGKKILENKKEGKGNKQRRGRIEGVVG